LFPIPLFLALTLTLTSVLGLSGAVATTASATAPTDPIEAAYTAPGPYATTTGTVSSDGQVIDDLYYPTDYGALGFKSPIVTWGNGTGATPDMYSTFLSHLASYGFTVVAPTLTNTGSGVEIDAAAHYLVSQATSRGSIFFRHLNVHRIAAVGHSQGATGATRSVSGDSRFFTTLMTFSLPSNVYSNANPDCATAAICTPHPDRLNRPAFFISTHGPLDSIIASPLTEHAYYGIDHAPAAIGIIADSDGTPADHNSIQDAANGGNPVGELGYATAWLEYQLRGNVKAGRAFSGRHPELLTNPNWPDSATKVTVSGRS
jgi:hypothetical protein